MGLWISWSLLAYAGERAQLLGNGVRVVPYLDFLGELRASD
ncbi:MAG: hypothetical protein AB1486_04835 [Planctomycetota bacterium]